MKLLLLLLFLPFALHAKETMREENLSDHEVREIQASIRKVYPEMIVNIGTVTMGCSCEEGPDCTSKVWVTSLNDNKMDALLMSRVGGRWLLSRNDQYRIDYERYEKMRQKVNDSRDQYESEEDWKKAIDRVIKAFRPKPVPLCGRRAESYRRRAKQYREFLKENPSYKLQ